MWKKVYIPLLNEYKDHDSFDEKIHADSYGKLKNAMYTIGDPHSFRCEWLFIQSRVRYFELIPTWEIERVRDDFKDHFENIVSFRKELLEKHPEVLERDRYESDYMHKKAVALYSQQKEDEMAEIVKDIRKFLEDWCKAKPSVYDPDLELHRKKTRTELRKHVKTSQQLYDYYFLMGFMQFRWKEGKPHDFDSDNFNFRDSAAKFSRLHVTRHSRLEIRRTAREI